MSFPRLIHIVWFQGVTKLTRPAFMTNVKNWQILNPDWKVNVLDDNALKDECRKHSDAALATYCRFATMHQKIDFGRFVTLYNLGGIYVDMDAYAFRPLGFSNQILQLISRHEKDKQLTLGISLSSASPFQSYVMSQGKSSVFLNNAILMGSPGQPDLGNFIARIIHIMTTNPKASLQDSTGPRVFGEFFMPLVHEPNPNIIVFPANVFEPCSLDGSCRIDDQTIALHRYELSWISRPLRRIAMLYVRHSEVINTILVIAAVMYLFKIRVVIGKQY